MVGLETTLYSVPESVGVVEICAIVYEPINEECPIDFPFDVELFTENMSAGIHIYTHQPNPQNNPCISVSLVLQFPLMITWSLPPFCRSWSVRGDSV